MDYESGACKSCDNLAAKLESMQSEIDDLVIKKKKLIDVIADLIPEILDLDECDKLIAGLRKYSTPPKPKEMND